MIEVWIFKITFIGNLFIFQKKNATFERLLKKKCEFDN